MKCPICHNEMHTKDHEHIYRCIGCAQAIPAYTIADSGTLINAPTTWASSQTPFKAPSDELLQSIMNDALSFKGEK